MKLVAAIGGGGGTTTPSSISSSSSSSLTQIRCCLSSSSPASNVIVRHHQYQHLSAFTPISHIFSPPLAATIRRRKPRRVFLPHLVASLEQVDVTYIMIKPDGVQRGLVGDIISRFENKGFKLTGLKLFQCPKELAEVFDVELGEQLEVCGVHFVLPIPNPRLEHYKDLSSKSFFPKLIDYITSGPVVCMAWEGIGVVPSARKLIGATNPLQAEPGTIRGDFAVQTGRNVIHGSDSPENGKREIALWFKEGELCDWTPVHSPWITE